MCRKKFRLHHKSSLVGIMAPLQFFAQGDREREAGMPISPLMDRNKEGVSKAQAGVSARLPFMSN